MGIHVPEALDGTQYALSSADLPAGRSARRVAAARAAAAAGGLLSLSMVLLGQPVSVQLQPSSAQITVRAAPPPATAAEAPHLVTHRPAGAPT
jgi:hypothetical protein